MTANGNVATFNPILSFLTGAHNNLGLLGSTEQAKSAMFYLVPYQGKNKFPIQQSLVVIDAAIKHCQKHESKTVKDDLGTAQRTSKQLLSRILNQMHLQLELSDYQIAAALLELPSTIECDKYEYGNPSALSSFRLALQMEKDNEDFLDKLYDHLADMQDLHRSNLQSSLNLHPNNTPNATQTVEDDNWSMGSFIVEDSDDSDDSDNDSSHSNASIDARDLKEAEARAKKHIEAPFNRNDLLNSLGYTDIIKLKNQLTANGIEAGMEPRKIIVPKVSHYLHRGNDLKCLNYYEYLGCVRFEKEAAGKSKNAAQFPMDPAFEGATDCRHSIKLKQTTPILLGTCPPHPGEEPLEPLPHQFKTETRHLKRHKIWSLRHNVWKKKANDFARHHLLLFRPETIHSNFSYTWNDLVDWTQQLTNDHSIISKFRLMTLDNHIKKLRTSSAVKKMTLSRRSRARHLWTKEEREDHNTKAALQNSANFRKIQKLIDEAENTGAELTQRQMKEVQQSLQHDWQQNQDLLEALGINRSTINNQKVQFPRSVLCDRLCKDVQTVYKSMQDWDKDPKTGESDSADKDPSDITPEMHIRNKIREIQEKHGAENTTQQVELYKLYADHFAGTGPPPPAHVIIHGGPGMGKSNVRDHILDTATYFGKTSIQTAFQAINALQMPNGNTTASLISQNAEVQTVHLGAGLKDETVQNLRKQNITADSNVYIEEGSTQAPWHIAQLNRLVQLTTNNHDKPFGGCQTTTTADFTQLGPVNSGSIPRAIMEIHACDYIQRWWKKNKRKRNCNRKKPSQRLIDDKGSSDNNRFQPNHPYSTGANLLAQARIFELTQQQRAILDPGHIDFVSKHTYNGKPLHPNNIKERYDIGDKETLSRLEWILAPILVSTNRERRTLTHTKCIQFAIATQQVVIRWLTDYKKWIGRPDPEFISLAQSDPCFYEYFVKNAPAYIIANLFKSLHIVNGTKCTLHSIKFDPDVEAEIDACLLHGTPGEVITASAPPISINVELHLHSSTPQHVVTALQSFSIGEADDEIIIPILSAPFPKDDNRPTPVCGGEGFLPSKVTLEPRFPLTLAFAITVHKSQGMTMEKVIIALSKQPLAAASFSYEQLHVAFSRVVHSNDIRLLLAGKTEAEKWASLSHLSTLKQDPAIKFFLGGFRKFQELDDPNSDWTNDSWSPERANENFIRLIHAGLV